MPRKYSPTRREYFVRNHRPAGARPCCETLDYEDCGSENCTPQYAGNVSRMVHTLAHGNKYFSTFRNTGYAYDMMNRLTAVDDSEIDRFDETFSYDAQGRMTSQRREGEASDTTGGEYAYYSGTNRLEKVSAGMGGTGATRDMGADSNFVYDADGNMTYDASKKMTVSYDYRGLPAEFRREVASASGIAGAVDSVRLLMAYDGSGARIGKRYERKDAGDTAWTLQLATHYTGIGSEIRVSGLDGTAKVVVNLPQGLGRYAVASASENTASSVPSFEWYLKNHLGSTMLVYGTGDGAGSLKAAYDYRAFGEQVNLNLPTDKVTENFTGKELDDETDLGYWGARYIDLALGLWISVDAARQYQNPYLYGGNNPVNRTDPDGNQDANALGLETFFRDQNINTAKAAEGTREQLPQALKTCAKTGLTAVAVADPEPASRTFASFSLFAINSYDAISSGDNVGLAVTLTSAFVSSKLPDNLPSRVTQALVGTAAEFSAKKLLDDPASQLKLLPTSGPTPADKTNTAIPVSDQLYGF